ncbi:unnamed protein product [[Candida] boidinii]|nr:unnamed protein product [[Candida] boidinii]
MKIKNLMKILILIQLILKTKTISGDNDWDDDWGTRGENINGDEEVVEAGNSSIHDDNWNVVDNNPSSRGASAEVDFWGEEKQDAKGREEHPQSHRGAPSSSGGSSSFSPKTPGGAATVVGGGAADGLKLTKSPPTQPAAKLSQPPRFGQRSSSSPVIASNNSTTNPRKTLVGSNSTDSGLGISSSVKSKHYQEPVVKSLSNSINPSRNSRSNIITNKHDKFNRFHGWIS